MGDVEHLQSRIDFECFPVDFVQLVVAEVKVADVAKRLSAGLNSYLQLHISGLITMP